MKHRAAPRRCQAAHANSAFYKKSTARFGQSGEGWILLAGTERCCARQDAPFFTELFGEFAASQRAGRVAGPYRTPANPYRPAKFDCKADLPHPFKRNYLQIRCTVTGGAYHSGSRRRLVENGLDGTSLRCSRSLFSCLGCI